MFVPLQFPATPGAAAGSNLQGRLLAMLLLASSPAAWAHAFQQRYELPLPLAYFVAGAGLAVALSFVVMALVVRHGAPLPQYSVTLPQRLVRVVTGVLRFVGLGFFFLVLSAGFLGAQGDWDSNPLPVMVWVIWWIGLAFVVALVGNVWAVLDPGAAWGPCCLVRPRGPGQTGWACGQPSFYFRVRLC